MSNIAGKAYAINVATPIHRGFSGVSALIFQVTRSIPQSLGGLLGLLFIHFARWAIVKKDGWPDIGQGKERLRHDYMIFCSNFNGTWDQYIDAFSDGLPQGLNLYWYGNLGYPGSIPITPFKTYIRNNQFNTDYYYNATPGATQRDIKSALRVRAALTVLAQRHAADHPDSFAAAYRAMLRRVQNDLGSQGPAPVASTDTAAAAVNKLAVLKGIQAWQAAQAAPAGKRRSGGARRPGRAGLTAGGGTGTCPTRMADTIS